MDLHELEERLLSHWLSGDQLFNLETIMIFMMNTLIMVMTMLIIIIVNVHLMMMEMPLWSK